MPKPTDKLKLPHPELQELVAVLKANVTRVGTCEVEGTDVRYFICDPWPEWADLAMYDEDGNIYLPESFVSAEPEFAYLVVLHEHVEIVHKLAGRSHAYAHRRAYLAELLAAKEMFDGPGELRQFLKRRIGGYPDWKVPNKAEVEERLYDLLQATRPLRGRLIEVMTAARL
ncbi:MAG: hypothetical protein OXG33_05350 [Chloroflexi bacterium]|nr:hypothetical protein [Chloroflexota bacterium]